MDRQASSRVSVLAVLLALLSGAAPGAAKPALLDGPQGAAPTQPAQTGIRLRLRDEAITKAVRESLAEPSQKPGSRDAGPLRGDRYEEFRRRVDEAVVPSCLHPDALRYQPAHIGPVGLGGIYALPFLAMAAIHGKCR